MSPRTASFLMASVLTAAALIMAAGPAFARGGGGGHGGGGGPGGGGRGGAFRGTGFRNGFRDGRGFRNDFFRDRGFRGFYGSGFYPGFYGYGGGGYWPSYGDGSSNYPNYVPVTAPATSASNYSPQGIAAPATTAPGDLGVDRLKSAYIRIKLPADAEVWFGGAKTSQTGPSREFVSPPLMPGKSYVYEVRCRWTANGQTVEQRRKVDVRANTWTNVDLTRSGRGTAPLSVSESR